jgi:polysaccharide biosynthesis transport protein
VDLRHQLAFIRASLPLIVIAAIAATVMALAVSLVLPKSYEGRVVLTVGQSTTNGASSGLDALQASQLLSQTFADLAVTNRIAVDVIRDLGLETTSEQLLASVHSQATLGSTLVTITVDDPDPTEAARIANGFAAEVLKEPASGSAIFTEMQTFVEQDLLQTRAQIDSLQVDITNLVATKDPTPEETDQLARLEEQIATARSTFATLLSLSTGAPANQVSIFDPAIAPTAPVAPRVALNTILGGTLGLVLGIALAYTRRRLDDSVRTPEEVELLTGLPNLGTIVRMPGDNRRPLFYRLSSLLYPRSPAAEGFRQVRTSVEFAAGETPVRTLLITSAMPGDGKTTFASNLAVSFAQAGRRVCLVDGDLRKPELDQMFRIPNEVGLADLLGGHELTFEAATAETEVPGLRVLTSGKRPANPAELVATGSLPAILTSLLLHVDLVVIDSPPLQAVTDAAILASISDGTILVTASGKTRRGAVVRGSDTLRRVGAHVLGFALNGVTEQDGHDAALGYFSYYGDAAVQSAAVAAAGVAGGPVPDVDPRGGSTVRVESTGSDR